MNTQDTSNLEKEFQSIQKELDKATRALKKANQLATKLGRGNIHELIYESCGMGDDDAEEMISEGGLFAELEKAGWNTSSMSC